MEHTTRENSFSKRGRKVGEAEGSPLYKKPKRCCSSPVTKPHSTTPSEDHIAEDKKYSEDLVLIRHAVEDLQLSGRDFYQEQQRRYEDMQSLGREFHQLQQKRYDGLKRWIVDTERRVDRKIEQLKKEAKSEPNKGEYALSGLKDHATEGILPDESYIDVGDRDVGERTVAVSSTWVLPSSLSDIDILNDKCRSGHETEPSRREISDNGLFRFTAQEERTHPPRDSGLVNEVGKQGQIPSSVSPIKSAIHSPTPSLYVDPSDCDDEDGGEDGPSGEFRGGSLQDEISQSSGLLNDDGAIEGMEIGPGSLDVGIYVEQRHNPPATPSLSQDRVRPCASGNTTLTPGRTKITSPQPMRSLRKRRSIDYYKVGPSIDESDEFNASPPNETPSKISAKTPPRRKSRKKADESHYLDSAKEDTTKGGTGRKKSASKSSGGMKFGSMDKFVVKQLFNQGPTPTPAKPLRETDSGQSNFLPSQDDSELEPNWGSSSSSGASQLGTLSKIRLTGVFPQAPRPRVALQPSDAAAAASARYRAVRTSPVF